MTGSSVQDVFGYLTMPEIRFLNAAVERLIPTDELGAGARDAGVTVYIDRQLCSVWGAHGRNYRGGPWLPGTAEQGYQLPLTPQDIYRIGIREVNDYCLRTHEAPFDRLPENRQDAILKALEKDEIELPSLSARLFFNLLWRNTEEGYFADPIYGGNRDKVGWKLIGFPGLPSGAYREHLDKDQPYRAEPVSILDVQRGVARLDAQGFVKHVMITNDTEK